MKPRAVRTPEGRDWTVRRVWLPRAPRWIGIRLARRSGPSRRDRGVWWELLDPGLAFDEGGGCLIPLVGVLLLALVVIVGVPVLIFVFDLLIIALLVILGVIARVLFRRPWLVRVSSGEVVKTYRVVGWRRSGEAMDEIEKILRRGASLPERLRAQG